MKKIVIMMALLIGLVASAFAINYVPVKDWNYCIDYEDVDEEVSNLRVFRNETFSNIYDTYTSLFGKPVSVDVDYSLDEIDTFVFRDLEKDFYVLYGEKEGIEFFILTGRLANSPESVSMMWYKNY